ncbi:MAG: carboxypeptidase-like regulatory domain-containing protein [Candidatus Bathyarchaeia archaeon]
MQKKLVATLTIAIFLISTFAIIVPTQAHFTLGNLSGTSPYAINNFDPHVAGPIGYVWPGSGECAYLGFPNEASDNCSPGYQSPYPNGNPPGAPSNSWYQLEGDTYAPFGAVLTSSTGDLIFAINATCLPANWKTGCGTTSTHEIQSTLKNNYGWDTLNILIPPEFTVHDASQIVTTLTNSYDNVWVGRLSLDDRYAPGWTSVMIITDSAENPGYNHQFLNFTSAGEWYYVRINGVTAPATAGRYFFKMFLYSNLASGANQYGVGPTQASSGGASGGENPDVWVPPQNWPVLLVKGETDPAIITGTLRYAGYNSTLYQLPIAEAGMVWANMTMRIDPYTGQDRPDLPTINAQAYVNATANGHYELEGLAPGVYDIYASAAGYPQSLCETGVTVLKGQSLHFDCYLQPGPVIHGNVFTKHQFGDEPWPTSYDSGSGVYGSVTGATVGQYIKIELYSAATLSNLVDPSAGNPVSWSPLLCTAGGQEKYYGRRAAGLCGDPRTGSAIAFPWHEYSTVNGATYGDVPNPFTGAQNGYSRDVSETNVCAPGNLACTFLTSDPEGVGPPQQWYVSGGTTTPFHFEFGLKGEYGAPQGLSGEVPQVYATWVNGLTPGRYYVRAWIFRYVQTALDGSTFQEYYFDVTPNEWAGDVTLPLDLRLSSWVNKTVYFHDTPNTIVTSPIHSGAGFIWGNLIGADGHVYAHNVTNLGYDSLYYACTYDSNSNGRQDSNTGQFVSYGAFLGSGEFGAPSNNCSHGTANELDKAELNKDAIATGRADIQFWGLNDTWGGENYGIPSGTYTPNVATDGYYSQSPSEQVSVTLSGNPTTISDHMFLGPGFNVSVYSIDWERPRVSRDWVWSGCQDAGAFGLANGNTNAAGGAQSSGSNAGKDNGCVGSEIDLGFYPVVNGTAGNLYDAIGDTPSYFYLPPSIFTTHLFQGPEGTDCFLGTSPAYTCTEMDGGGRNVLQTYQLSHDVFYGESARYAFVGGYTAGKNGFTTAPKLLVDSMFTQRRVVWPITFNQGPYNLAGYTYGYIQDKDFTAYAQNGQVADMKINLIIGVNVTLDILFKKESIITPTDENMSARVRLFNDQEQLVSEWMSSEGVYPGSGTTSPFGVGTGHVTAANGALPPGGSGFVNPSNPLYPFTDQAGLQKPASGLNAYNYVPSNTTLLHVLMAGLPQQPPGGKFLSNEYFSDPLQGGGGTFGDCDFNLVCFPAAYAQYPFPYTGIAGAPDYTGGWTAEVDFVPWYAANTATPELASGGAQACNLPIFTSIGSAAVAFCTGQTATTPGSFAQYYPPVNGLLMGESYHIIPGTTATSGISVTEDTATNQYVSPPGSAFVGHSMAPNHLGPYSQEGVWQIAGTHNSGEASAIFEVDLNGFVSGNVLAFTWSNEFRTLSWGTISVVGASGATWNFYTFDGVYQAFLPPGSYKFSIAQPGYAPQTWSYSVAPGQSGSGANVYLEQSNIPVPEFSTVAVVAFSALAASLYLLKRRRD